MTGGDRGALEFGFRIGVAWRIYIYMNICQLTFAVLLDPESFGK